MTIDRVAIVAISCGLAWASVASGADLQSAAVVGFLSGLGMMILGFRMIQ